jgi:hypothetical protein
VTTREIEYEALRATIRERGTARLVLVPIIFIGWAAAAIATAAVIEVALSTVVPLVVLAAGFEAIFALHVNVERVGRYLQVFHEPQGSDGWEHVAMAFGRTFKGTGPDPLFQRLFGLTVSVNFIPVALGGELWEVVFLAVLHLALIYRIRTAKAFAASQRVEDLARFERLRAAPPESAGQRNDEQ